MIPFKWAASHFSSQNSVAQHFDTSSEHQPLISTCSSMDKELPCYRKKSPNLLASSAQQHLRLQPASYVLFIWHTISHQEDSLGRAFKGSTFTLCNKSWIRESSEIKGLMYDLLFYIAFSLLFVNYLLLIPEYILASLQPPLPSFRSLTERQACLCQRTTCWQRAPWNVTVR